jgi:hypothetical protein
LRNTNQLRRKAVEKPQKVSAAFDPVAFLVRFMNTDLGQLREGDRLNLLDDFGAFVGAELSGLAFEPTDERPTIDGAGVQRLQTELRELIRPIAESQTTVDPQSRFGRIVAEHAGLAGAATSYSRPVKSAFVGMTRAPGKGSRLRVSAPHAELVFLKAALLLLVVKTPAQQRLRVCPECGDVFLRVRKQRYCTRRCVNKVNMRAWVARTHGKASHRASSRKSYVKRVRARISPNVKVHQRVKK